MIMSFWPMSLGVEENKKKREREHKAEQGEGEGEQEEGGTESISRAKQKKNKQMPPFYRNEIIEGEKDRGIRGVCGVCMYLEHCGTHNWKNSTLWGLTAPRGDQRLFPNEYNCCLRVRC